MYEPLLKKDLGILIALIAGLTFTSCAQIDGNTTSLNDTDGQFNGTVYHLFDREVQVTLPVNGTQANLSLFDKAENMTLYDASGHNVSFESSYQFRRGEHIYSLKFEKQVQGKLVYSIAHRGQQFILPLTDAGPVRIILPPGYTTGERGLGIASPAPDIFQSADFGDILTWNNSSQIPYVEVNYYRKSAPQALAIILSILAVAGLVLLVRYYISTKR